MKRGNAWAFNPAEAYEQHGDVSKVVFPCGTTLAPDGDSLRLYYGAADTSIAMATLSIQAILQWLNERAKFVVGSDYLAHKNLWLPSSAIL